MSTLQLFEPRDKYHGITENMWSGRFAKKNGLTLLKPEDLLTKS